MGTRLPNESPTTSRVPGERALALLGRLALLVAGLTVIAAGVAIYIWWMVLLATNAGGGIKGVLAWCLVVVMAALAVAALAGAAWATLQNPKLRRRFR